MSFSTWAGDKPLKQNIPQISFRPHVEYQDVHLFEK